MHTTHDAVRTRPLETDLTASTSMLAWIVCFCASLYFFYEFIQLNIFNSLDVYLMKELHINATQTGNLSSLYFYANVIFLFPAGLLLDRLSTRKLIITAMLIGSTSTLIFSYSHSLLLTAACRFMTGTGAAFCFLSCIRIASRWFPPHKLALVTGMIVTMAMLGGAVAQTPLSILIHHVGWRNAIFLDALLGYSITAIIWLTVQDAPPKHLDPHQHTPKHNMSILKSFLFVVRNTQNWLCGLYTSLLNLPIFLLGAIWGIMYLNQVQHLTETQASLATATLFFGTILGSPAFGWLSDRLLKRKLPMIIGGFLSLVTVLVLMYTPHLSINSIIVLFFLLGFFTSAQVLSYPLIAEHNPIHFTSSAISIASSCIMLGGIITQPLFGWLMERHWDHAFLDGHPAYTTNDFHSAMLIMPIAFIAGLIITCLIRESGSHTATIKAQASE